MSCKLKKGDTVKVIAGKDKGKEGKILTIDHKNDRVLVEGINKIHKHQKATAKMQNGGIIEKEAPLHISNVMYSANGTPSRIGFRMEGDKKVRYAKKTGKTID